MFNKYFNNRFSKNVFNKLSFFKSSFFKISFLIFVFSFFINTNISKADTTTILYNIETNSYSETETCGNQYGSNIDVNLISNLNSDSLVTNIYLER